MFILEKVTFCIVRGSYVSLPNNLVSPCIYQITLKFIPLSLSIRNTPVVWGWETICTIFTISRFRVLISNNALVEISTGIGKMHYSYHVTYVCTKKSLTRRTTNRVASKTIQVHLTSGAFASSTTSTIIYHCFIKFLVVCCCNSH